MLKSISGFRQCGRRIWKSVSYEVIPCIRQFTSIGDSRDSDTIYALCSGPLSKCGVSVIRVSGSNAFDAVRAMTYKNCPFPEVRKASLRTIIDSQTNEILDKGMVVCFNEGASYTNENVVEFHLHGSPAVVSAVLKSLSRFPHFRSADAGEFTRRAFMNGKMSFVEVEALGDLLNSETEIQRKQAMRGVNGELIDKCWKWRSTLMHSLANAETVIDFSDDVDDESIHLADATKDLSHIRDEMQTLLDGFDRGQLIKNGIPITLCGPPNAGKSSLLNELVGSDVAIVSSVPGTTRDVLKVDLNLDGYKVILQDTAGLHSSGDEIEQEGMNRAVTAAEKSLFQVVIVDVTGDVCSDVASIFERVKQKKAIVVLNKTDLVDEKMVEIKKESLEKQFPDVLKVIPISCRDTSQVARITSHLAGYVRHELECTETENTDLITRERQRNCLQQCILSLSNCIKETLVDLQAEELRTCLKSLAQLTGEVDVEEILDIVFSDFCIGK